MNFCNGAILWRISESANVTFCMFDFRQDMACVRERTHAEMDKPLVVVMGEIVQICLKIEYANKILMRMRPHYITDVVGV